MKGFKDSTRMMPGHNFARTSTSVKTHIRALPVKTPLGVSDVVPMSPKRGLPTKTVISVKDAVPEPMMAKGGSLDAAARKAIPSSEFGLPGSRKYPMPDRSHAANAKARATQMVAKGALSEGSKVKIDAKANKILNKAKGGPFRDPRTPLIKPKSGC